MADSMFKVINTDLNYGFTKNQLMRGKDDFISNSEITGQLILLAFQANHPQMSTKESKFYRMLRLNFGEEIEIKTKVQLSKNDFNDILKEINECEKWTPFHAFAVPVLLEHLTDVKNRTLEEDEQALKECFAENNQDTN